MSKHMFIWNRVMLLIGGVASNVAAVSAWIYLSWGEAIFLNILNLITMIAGVKLWSYTTRLFKEAEDLKKRIDALREELLAHLNRNNN